MSFKLMDSVCYRSMLINVRIMLLKCDWNYKLLVALRGVLAVSCPKVATDQQ